MGDVRLTSSKPPSPEQKVLYFTAQWERDGGGVYDVSKFVKPEVGFCCQKDYSLAHALYPLAHDQYDFSIIDELHFQLVA